MRFLLTWLLLTISLLTRANNNYTHLAIEGSGVRLFAYVGVLQVLDSAGILNNISAIGGTSGGAIMGGLVCAGYNPNELFQIATSVDVKKFADKGSFFESKIARFTTQFGLYKGDAFEVWYSQLLQQKLGKEDITLLQLHELTQQGLAKDLYAVATDLVTNKNIVLSYKTFPHMRVVDAVRASMSIPLVYRAVCIDGNGKRMAKPKDSDVQHVLVDGGLGSNFPLHMFDTISADNGERISFNKVLGIMLEEESVGQETPTVPHSLGQYIHAIYRTTIDKTISDTVDKQHTIIVPIKYISPRVRKVPPAEVEYMIRQGRNAALSFLNREKSHK